MKTSFFAAVLALAFTFVTASAHADTLSPAQVRDIANRGVALYNSGLPNDGSVGHERLFEAYRAISAENCRVTAKKITCEFDTTETWDTDADVYTPNTLTVTVDRASNAMNVDIEWGC